MASEERKAADNKIKEENLFNSLGAEDQQAETETFQCGRCKQVRFSPGCDNLKALISRGQRKCRYRQAQTRSADEPMTVSDLYMIITLPKSCKTDLCDVRMLKNSSLIGLR